MIEQPPACSMHMPLIKKATVRVIDFTGFLLATGLFSAPTW